MDRKKFDDGALDRLIAESLAGGAQPDGAMVAALRRAVRRKQDARGGLSLWWLPALCGTAASACTLYALSFVATDWKCFAAAALALCACTLSSWLLTIFGLIKTNSFKEASRLI